MLDWRLGVGLLRLMLDETYDFGFDASTRSRYEEMSDWNYIIHECAQKYNFAPESNEQYYWFKDGACTVFYHPLWNRKKLLENITEQYDGLHMFNTFKILRSDMTEDKDDSIVAHTCSGVKRLNRIKASKLNSSRTIAPQQIKTEDDNDVEL